MPNAEPEDRPALHDDELGVDAPLVKALLAEQCPQFAKLKLEELPSEGSSNWLFRLGRDKVLRFPRRPSVAVQVAKEQSWLPRLAPSLPLPIPTPLFHGQPSEAFPYCWSLLAWIEGRAPESNELADATGVAKELAGFIQALQAQDATGGPAPGAHNSGRGEPLVERDQAVRSCARELDPSFDTQRLLTIWDEALAAPPHLGPPVWLHGDLLPSNLLLGENGLAAVIDFGLLGVGDPACDLMAAWALFEAEARFAFRAALRPDDARWRRGQGWALSFAIIALPYYGPRGHPLGDIAAKTLSRILAEQR